MGRLVLLLLALNLGWLAWSQGGLRPLGLGPVVQTEPARMQRQLNPEAVRVEAPSARSPVEFSASPASAPASAAVAASEPAPAASVPVAPASVALPASPAEPASAPASVPPAPAAPASLPSSAGLDTRCLQAGPFDASQIEAVRGALGGLPAGSWRIDEPPPGGRWMVHLGGFADAAAVAARRAELRAAGIDTDRPGAALEPGLSLGRFASEQAADRARAELERKGVSGARVVLERRDAPIYLLRLPQADAALRQRVEELGDALTGKALQECP